MTDSPVRGPFAVAVTFLLGLLLSLVVGTISEVRAQTGGVVVPAEPTLEQAQRRLDEVQAAQTMDEAQRKAAAEYLRQAQEVLRTVDADLEATRQFRDTAARAPAQVKTLRDEVQKPPVTVDRARFEAMSLEQLESELSAAQADKDKLDAQLAGARERVERLGAASRDLRDSYARAEQELAKVPPDTASDLERAPPDARTTERARVFLESARRRALAARSERLRTELLTLDARLELATAQRDANVRALADAQARTKVLEAVVSDARAAVAKQAEVEAQAAAERSEGKHPVIQQVAIANTGLARDLASATATQADLATQRVQMEERLRALEEDYRVAQQRVNLAGLSSVLGQVLREQRRSLPDLRRVRAQTRQREQAVAQVGLAQLRVDDQIQALSQPDVWLANLAKDAGITLPAADQDDAFQRDLAPLLKDRRELLAKLHDAHAAQLKALAELEFAEQSLVTRTREYTGFLDEHLLWIPNAEPLSLATVSRFTAAVGWLIAPANLSALLAAVEDLVLSRPGALALLVLAVWILVHWRKPMHERQRAAAEAVSRAHTDGLGHTLATAGACLVLAAPIPLITAFIGWRLGTVGSANDYVSAVSAGLLAMSVPLFLVRVFRHVYARDGLGVAHFHWSETVAEKMRRYLRLVLLVVVPGVFLVVTMDAQPDLEAQVSLGRLAFIATALTLAYVMHALFHPARGVLHAYLTRSRDTWMSRLRHVWFVLAVGMPLSAAGLAAYGYYYTALRLNAHQISTLRLVIAAVVLYHFVLRALTVAQRRLELRAQLEAASEAPSDLSAEGSRVQLDIPAISLDAINHQSRRLALILIGWGVAAGVYLIWADVLPALGIFNEVTLWDSSSVVDGQTVVEHITMGSILLALVFGIVFSVAARNLPGVLEIAVLQNLPLDAGSRYAVTTISQYLIVAVGLVMIFQSLGVSWGNVQWLVAALGVGLGFGLQEIFANFVSGIIILFERPVRIGDTVTLGELTGTVSRIRIRATTVTDWDNKEIIIPNKSFITDRLINWTLSDSIMRLKVPIGIAYGSDTKLAYDVIWKVAEGNARVLPQPAMQLFFVGFGDSSLNFELRVFVGALSDLLKTTHELHMEINEALKENGIEIPFPQRDLHIRSAVPVPVQPGDLAGLGQGDGNNDDGNRADGGKGTGDKGDEEPGSQGSAKPAG